MKHANYTIVSKTEKVLVIKDEGPWHTYRTVTNDVEFVVSYLHRQGHLPEGCRLLYYDSGGGLDEIMVQEGKFGGFNFFPEEGGLDGLL